KYNHPVNINITDIVTVHQMATKIDKPVLVSVYQISADFGAPYSFKQADKSDKRSEAETSIACLCKEA
ncbi:MAG: hypothetical protein L3J79_00005, partial [Candidatus Marinimicrobia bacterium]|nr:hypothetical protein [Candidatus Neomarinimicrobiota bacterium]